MPGRLFFGGYTYDLGNVSTNPAGLQSDLSVTGQVTIGKTAVEIPWLGAGIGVQSNADNQFILNVFGYAAGQGINANLNLGVMGEKILDVFDGGTTGANVLETYQVGAMTGTGLQILGVGYEGTTFTGFGLDTVDGSIREVVTSTTNVSYSFLPVVAAQVSDQAQLYYPKADSGFNSSDKIGEFTSEVAGIGVQNHSPGSEVTATSSPTENGVDSSEFGRSTEIPGIELSYGPNTDVPGLSVSYPFELSGTQAVDKFNPINQYSSVNENPESTSFNFGSVNFTSETASEVAGIGLSTTSAADNGGIIPDYLMISPRAKRQILCSTTKAMRKRPAGSRPTRGPGGCRRSRGWSRRPRRPSTRTTSRPPGPKRRSVTKHMPAP